MWEQMYRKWMMLLIVLLLMGGCSLLDKWNQKSAIEDEGKANDTKEENPLEQYYVPVQEYTGEGFELIHSNPKTGKIAEANRNEVEEAVEDYFLEAYKTKVKVNHIVSAKDGVSVFVESTGNIEFYAMAIVPIDVQKEQVETEQVWSLEGDVEGAITSGLYVEAFQEEFDRLDEVLEEVAEKHGLTGIKPEVVENTMGDGYVNSYYFVTSRFDSLYDAYMKNPDISQKDLRSAAIEFMTENDYNLSEFNGIPIRFYLDAPELEPTDDLIHQIYEEISGAEGVPGGRYLVLLNDNNIDVRDASGDKDNSLTSIFHMEGGL